MKTPHRFALLAFTLGCGASLLAQPVCDGSGSGASCDGNGARGPGGPGHGKGGRHGGPTFGLMRVLDADQDYTLSAVEIGNSTSALRTLDLDGDGIVSAAEIHPARPANALGCPADGPQRQGYAPERPANGSRGKASASQRPANAPQRPMRSGIPQNPPLSPILLALDADQDGALSVSEIANAPASLAALDANGDGALTMDEFRPLPPTRE